MNNALQNERLILGFAMLVIDELMKHDIPIENAAQAVGLTASLIGGGGNAFLVGEPVKQLAAFLKAHCSQDEAMAALDVVALVLKQTYAIRAMQQMRNQPCNVLAPPSLPQ